MLTRIIVTFGDEGIEYAVSYAHADEPASPGSKKRTTRAATLARKGLAEALEGLDKGTPTWGGFAQGRAEATDHVLIERRSRKANAA